MLLRPTYPEAPAQPTVTESSVMHAPQAPVPACSCQHPHTPETPARRIAPAVGLGVGTVGAVVLVGVVLTALVTAVAVGAVSVAVAAVVLRSLLGTPRHR